MPAVLFAQLNVDVSIGGVLSQGYSQGYLGYQQVTAFRFRFLMSVVGLPEEQEGDHCSVSCLQRGFIN